MKKYIWNQLLSIIQRNIIKKVKILITLVLQSIKQKQFEFTQKV